MKLNVKKLSLGLPILLLGFFLVFSLAGCSDSGKDENEKLTKVIIVKIELGLEKDKGWLSDFATSAGLPAISGDDVKLVIVQSLSEVADFKRVQPGRDAEDWFNDYFDGVDDVNASRFFEKSGDVKDAYSIRKMIAKGIQSFSKPSIEREVMVIDGSPKIMEDPGVWYDSRQNGTLKMSSHIFGNLKNKSYNSFEMSIYTPTQNESLVRALGMGESNSTELLRILNVDSRAKAELVPVYWNFNVEKLRAAMNMSKVSNREWDEKFTALQNHWKLWIYSKGGCLLGFGNITIEATFKNRAEQISQVRGECKKLEAELVAEAIELYPKMSRTNPAYLMGLGIKKVAQQPVEAPKDDEPKKENVTSLVSITLIYKAPVELNLVLVDKANNRVDILNHSIEDVTFEEGFSDAEGLPYYQKIICEGDTPIDIKKVDAFVHFTANNVMLFPPVKYTILYEFKDSNGVVTKSTENYEYIEPELMSKNSYKGGLKEFKDETNIHSASMSDKSWKQIKFN